VRRDPLLHIAQVHEFPGTCLPVGRDLRGIIASSGEPNFVAVLLPPCPLWKDNQMLFTASQRTLYAGRARSAFTGTTTTEIAQRAGVWRGAQLHHDSTKIALVSSAIYLRSRRTSVFHPNRKAARPDDPGGVTAAVRRCRVKPAFRRADRDRQLHDARHGAGTDFERR